MKYYLTIFLMLILEYSNAWADDNREWPTTSMEDRVRNEASHQVKSLLTSGGLDFSLGHFGNMLWDGYIESSARSEIASKARQLKNFSPRSIKHPDNAFPNKNMWSNYGEISKLQSVLISNYFHGVRHVNLGDLGNGHVGNFTNEYADSLKRPDGDSNLKTLLTSTVIDSIGMMGTIVSTLIYHDLAKDRRLAKILNNHPEAVRVYANSVEAPSLRSNPAHLLYWGVTADSHRSKLSKKIKLPNPRQFVFVERGGVVDIILNGDKWATINVNNVIVENINIMNFMPMSNVTYKYGNNTWETDVKGRVVRASHLCGKSAETKCKQKSLIKPKDCLALLDASKGQQMMLINPTKYGGPEVFVNTYFYDKDSDNKDRLKAAEKQQKISTKNKTDVVRRYMDFDYFDWHRNPSIATISIGSQKFQLKNKHTPNAYVTSRESPHRQIEADNQKIASILSTRGKAIEYSGSVAKDKQVRIALLANAASATTSDVAKRQLYFTAAEVAIDEAERLREMGGSTDSIAIYNSLRDKYLKKGSEIKSTPGTPNNQEQAYLKRHHAGFYAGSKNPKVDGVNYSGKIDKYSVQAVFPSSIDKNVGYYYYKSQGKDKKLVLVFTHKSTEPSDVWHVSEYVDGVWNGRFRLHWDRQNPHDSQITGIYVNAKGRRFEVALSR